METTRSKIRRSTRFAACTVAAPKPIDKGPGRRRTLESGQRARKARLVDEIAWTRPLDGLANAAIPPTRRGGSDRPPRTSSNLPPHLLSACRAGKSNASVSDFALGTQFAPESPHDPRSSAVRLDTSPHRPPPGSHRQRSSEGPQTVELFTENSPWKTFGSPSPPPSSTPHHAARVTDSARSLRFQHRRTRPPGRDSHGLQGHIRLPLCVHHRTGRSSVRAGRPPHTARAAPEGPLRMGCSGLLPSPPTHY